jgi:ribose-phosphate pyrophosphokinase
VVVAPDLGAVKLAERYARAFDRSVAIVHKTRLTGRDVAVRSLVGDVRDRAPLVVDDMISTGGTIEAAVRAVLAAGAVPEVTVAASHGLFVGPAADRLRGLAVGRFLVTDSVTLPGALPLSLEVAGLAPLLAEAVAGLHGEQPVGHLLACG